MKELVDDFINNDLPGIKAERKRYRKMTLDEAIMTAALSVDEVGRRESHQRRRQEETLRKAAQLLTEVKDKLIRAQSFDDLHEEVRKATVSVRDFGVLTIYDVAERIGCNLGISPHAVYLHAGPREAAALFGIKGKQRVQVRHFPEELHRLKPRDVENFLCIKLVELKVLAKYRRLPKVDGL